MIHSRRFKVKSSRDTIFLTLNLPNIDNNRGLGTLLKVFLVDWKSKAGLIRINIHYKSRLEPGDRVGMKNSIYTSVRGRQKIWNDLENVYFHCVVKVGQNDCDILKSFFF